MVQALDPVLGVNTFYHHHCHEHVGVGQLGRITGEKGLNLVGFTRGNYEIDLIAGVLRVRATLSTTLVTWAMTIPLP